MPVLYDCFHSAMSRRAGPRPQRTGPPEAAGTTIQIGV